MLRSSYSQLGLLYRDGADSHSDMPAFPIQLGSFRSRDMRRSKLIEYVPCSVQFTDGRRNGGITTTCPIGAANANWTKNRSDLPLFDGYSVSEFF